MDKAMEIIGKFARIASDAYGDYGLNRGDLVAVAGSGFAPVDDDDNYKLLFVVSKYEDGRLENRGTVINRGSLEVLPDEESEKLMEVLTNVIQQEQEAAAKQAAEQQTQ